MNSKALNDGEREETNEGEKVGSVEGLSEVDGNAVVEGATDGTTVGTSAEMHNS